MDDPRMEAGGRRGTDAVAGRMVGWRSVRMARYVATVTSAGPPPVGTDLLGCAAGAVAARSPCGLSRYVSPAPGGHIATGSSGSA